MKNILTNIKNYISKASVNKKLYVFLVCLSLSTFYWLINVLDNQYNSDLEVEVEYINHPPKYVILSELPSQLKVTVTSNGYDLLWYQLNLKKAKVTIDMSKYQIDGIKTDHKIYFNNFLTTVSNQIGNKIVIDEILPKFVTVQLDYKIEKQLRVVPDIKLGFKNEYQLSDSLIITPQTVFVIGPKSILDSLNFIPTNKLEIDNIESSLMRKVGLNDNFIKNNHLYIKNSTFRVEIITDKFTEFKLNLPISIVNLSDSVNIDIIPQLVEVKFLAPLTKLSTLDANDFTVMVNFNELSQSYKKLTVHLLKYPNFVRNIVIKPAKVEYVLKRKEI